MAGGPLISELRVMRQCGEKEVHHLMHAVKGQSGEYVT